MYSREQVVSWMMLTRKNVYNAVMALRSMTNDESVKDELAKKLFGVNDIVDQIWEISEKVEKEVRSGVQQRKEAASSDLVE